MYGEMALTHVLLLFGQNKLGGVRLALVNGGAIEKGLDLKELTFDGYSQLEYTHSVATITLLSPSIRIYYNEESYSLTNLSLVLQTGCLPTCNMVPVGS